VLAFNDRNDNGLYDGNEELVAQVAVHVMMGSAVVVTYTTNGVDEPKCLAGLTPGVYAVQAALPGNRLPATPSQVGVALAGGQTASVAFGVRPMDQAPAKTSSDLSLWARHSKSIAGILSVSVLIIVAGLAAMAIIRRK
jgi:hypothetical protein